MVLFDIVWYSMVWDFSGWYVILYSCAADIWAILSNSIAVTCLKNQADFAQGVLGYVVQCCSHPPSTFWKASQQSFYKSCYTSSITSHHVNWKALEWYFDHAILVDWYVSSAEFVTPVPFVSFSTAHQLTWWDMASGNIVHAHSRIAIGSPGSPTVPLQ